MSDGPTQTAAPRPGSWIVRPAWLLAAVCVVMSVQALVRFVLAEERAPGTPWNAFAFLSVGLLFAGQAGSIQAEPSRKLSPFHVCLFVGATAGAFFTWLWLSELSGGSVGDGD